MKNEIIENIECLELSQEGMGICKNNGQVIFVKEMLPNEVADIKIISDKKNYAFGIIDKMIKKSEYRIDSLCPISRKCGGCDFRYIDYDYQLVLKKQMLENIFRNLDVKVLDVIKSDNPYYYRNKVQVPVCNHEFGFYRKFSNDIVEFDECLIQSHLSNEIFLEIKKIALDIKIDKYFRHILIKHALGTNEVMIGLIVSDFNIPDIDILINKITKKYESVKSIILNLNQRNDNVILGDKEKVIFGNSYIVDEFAGIKVRIALKSFYQTNTEMMIKLYDKVKEYASLNKSIDVLDLYSGIGSISLYLAKYARNVKGVEIINDAVINANENVKLNGYHNVQYYLDDAGKNFANYLSNESVIIVDPPRKGLTSELIQALDNSNANKIIYVSCNPVTLCRDLLLFKNYHYDTIQPVDMFPFTKHVETVVCLEKRTSLHYEN